MGSVTTTPGHTPALVMGGAGFSYQLHPAPQSLPVQDILLRAFELGVRTLDTSPYYEPSEQLMGAALAHTAVRSRYSRHEYQLMTKVGRIKEHEFNYSPQWIRKSVARSLERFQTSYLDVVFCHDVEFVSLEEAVTAVGVLFDFKNDRVIHRVGISGYDMDVLVRVAAAARERYGKPLDVVQTWAQLTLQNTQAASRGFEQFRAVGVHTVFCSSPLAVGLLRSGGIPVGLTGDWHPAPKGLRAAAAKAAEWVEEHGNGESFSSIALQYAIGMAKKCCASSFSVSTITGISTISELEQNVTAAKKILQPASHITTPPDSGRTLQDYTEMNEQAWRQNESAFSSIRAILGEWVDYDFTTKKSVVQPERPAREDQYKGKVPCQVCVEVVAKDNQSQDPILATYAGSS